MLRKSSLILLILLISAYVGNYFNLSLFFGVDFLFGGIAVLLVISLFGLRWGLLAAFISSSYTIVLWSHPYAAFLLIGEVVFVGLLLKRKRNLLALVMTYWLTIGMPLVWIFYRFLLQVDVDQVIMIALKQAVNEIFNAVVASLLLSQLPLHKWIPEAHLTRKIPFQQTLLNLLFAFVFIPALLLMILQGHRVVNDTENVISNQLQFVSVDGVVSLRNWYNRRTQVLEELAQTIAKTDINLSLDAATPGVVSGLQQDTELIRRLFPDFYNLYVIDSSGRIVASYPKIDEVGTAIARSEAVDKSTFEQIQKTLLPQVSGVKRDRNNIPRVGLSTPILKQGKFQGIVYAALDLSQIREQLSRYVNDRDFQVTLIEKSGRVLASTKPALQSMQAFNLQRSGQIQLKENGLYQWLPVKAGMPPMVRWKKSFYVLESQIALQLPWTLVSELPANAAITHLQNIYIYNLVVMLVISALAAALAAILSRRLVNPLVYLAQETTNLPNKLSEEGAISWVDSAIAEIDSLAHNFQLMGFALSQKFQEIQRSNETLEQKVEQRTAKLTNANRKLKNQIIERKRAERALRENEERLARILETIPNGITILSTDGQIISANAAAESILGLVRSRITERLYNDMAWSITTVDGEPFPNEALPFVQVLTTGKPVYGVEHAIVRPDGKRIILSINASPLFDSEGQISSVITALNDITAQKQAEHERAQLVHEQAARAAAETARQQSAFLAEVSASLASLLDYEQTLQNIANLTVPTFADWCCIDLLGSDQRIHRVAVAHGNPEKVKLGWEIAQRYPKYLEDGCVDRVIQTGKTDITPEITDEDLEASIPDVEYLNLVRTLGLKSCIVAPLKARERILGTLCLVFAEADRRYSRTDLSFVEDLARRTALAIDNSNLYREAQQANRIKDEFLAVLSHELRSPLNPILGWSALLRTQKVAPEKMNYALETIERNAKLQAQLVEDLLDISRMLRGKLSLQVAPVDLITVIQAAIDTVHLSAAARSIRVETVLPLTPTTVLGDANRLQQVVWNLLSNAVKFTPDEGRVEVKLATDCEADETDGGAVTSVSSVPKSVAQITVTDTGKGIPPDFLPYVFDYFRQADSSITRHFGGLGLGLAIARQIVELHGGTIWADSSGEGQGAIFTVNLPLLSRTEETDLLPQQPVNRTSDAVDSQALKGLQVLVIDDETDMRELVEFVLLEHGAQVMTVSSAQEALDRLIHFIPDVLLCDIGMPEMDGYTFMRQVRGWLPENGGTTPAIALTAYAGEYDRQRALAAGFQLHLPKPIQSAELVKAVRQVVHQGIQR